MFHLKRFIFIVLTLFSSFPDHAQGKYSFFETGIYVLNDNSDSKLLLDKTELTFNIGRQLASAKEIFIMYMSLTLDDDGYSRIMLTFCFEYDARDRVLEWSAADTNAIFGLICNGKLIDTFCGAQVIPRGNRFGPYRNVYSIMELANFYKATQADMTEENRKRLPKNGDNVDELLKNIDRSKSRIIY